jgi:acyl carrier protein
MEAETVEVTNVIVGILEDLTQDWGLELDKPIGPDTRLVDDLEFASVDIIQLCVAIEEHYDHSKMGFQDLLMLDGRYVDDLKVEQFAVFVADKITGAVSV